MKITKLNLGSFVPGTHEKSEADLPAVPKNFSYFGKKNNQEEPEFTKTDLTHKTQENYKKGIDEGYVKGKEEVMQQALLVEKNTRIAVEQLVATMTKFLAQYDEEKKNYMRNMTRVAIIAIQKIAEKTIRDNTEEVILQALEKSSHIFSKQPEIIFKAKKIILEKIQDKVDNIIKSQDFKGKISFIPDDSIATGAAVIEWGESGVSINSNEALKQVEEIISEYLKSI